MLQGAAETVWSISIHAPREGGDLLSALIYPRVNHFNPRPPRGGRHGAGGGRCWGTYFNPRPREGGDSLRAALGGVPEISIHAPREGGDRWNQRKEWMRDISIHAPREGGDHRGGVVGVQIRISIHAPREGGDAVPCSLDLRGFYFNPRPPRGGRLFRGHRLAVRQVISIHAPREGGDGPMPVLSFGRTKNFNPRPPARGATTQNDATAADYVFQSTPPRGGRRWCKFDLQSHQHISIHAPREGGDSTSPPPYRPS